MNTARPETVGHNNISWIVGPPNLALGTDKKKRAKHFIFN
jgi:hypothetical protein